MKTVYFFSGLGADERVFQYLDLSFCNSVFIQWNLPLKDESIENYALRLTGQIKDENPILVGVSFGGMMAVEVAKIIKTEKVILISSAKTKNEIPPYYRLSAKVGAHKMVPFQQLKKVKSVNYFLFGVKNPQEKTLLDAILEDTNPDFLRWAVSQIVNWKNEFIPENLIHIHGTSDKMLPYRYIKSDYSIENGGHLMIVRESPKISKILRKLILSV